MPFDKPSSSDSQIASWLEMRDLEAKSYDTATWIPLLSNQTVISKGERGQEGYRKEYRSIESLVIPEDRLEEFDSVDWQSLTRNSSDSPWVEDDQFIPPGTYHGDRQVLYPVLCQSFDTGEPTQWSLIHEIELGLNLMRSGDTWISPSENDVVVARILRQEGGEVSTLEIRAEYLRDYLCARRSRLLLTNFTLREAVEKEEDFVSWNDKLERTFVNGSWDGNKVPIRKGGGPFDSAGVVLRMWRESVDPGSDLPTMPHPCAETEPRSEVHELKPSGEKLWSAKGRIWLKHYIHPSERSPRVRGDKVSSSVQFLVDNQEQRSLAGDALSEYRGWLWFRPAVVKALLHHQKSALKWYTRDTGEIGPDIVQTLHFGMNALGLINVLGYKMAALPQWVQKLWVPYNVTPEGGLSEELHMSQNLAAPARTLAPEFALFHNLEALSELTSQKYGQSILRKVSEASDFYKRIHRFYGDSFESFCQLCKELHRTIAEQFDIGVINSKIDSANAEQANKQNMREIKRVAYWLSNLGFDGRQLTQTFAGICDLRVGDAHSSSESVRESLELLGIPKDATNYPKMCFHVVAEASNAVGKVCAILDGQLKPITPSSHPD